MLAGGLLTGWVIGAVIAHVAFAILAPATTSTTASAAAAAAISVAVAFLTLAFGAIVGSHYSLAFAERLLAFVTTGLLAMRLGTVVAGGVGTLAVAVHRRALLALVIVAFATFTAGTPATPTAAAAAALLVLLAPRAVAAH